MSKFKYCPMCGMERADNSQYCPNCHFEFLSGKYIKVEEEKTPTIQFEKVSSEEFVESNQLIKDTNLKLNTLIANYLNNALSNQFNENYDKNISFGLKEYTYFSIQIQNFIIKII